MRQPSSVIISKPGIYDVSAADYHADCCVEASLSASIAKVLVSESPLHAWTEHPRLNPDFENKERTDFDLGSAAHAVLLEGVDRMAIIHADSYRTDKAKDARDAARANGKHPVLVGVYRDVLKMHELAVKAIAECVDLGGLTLADGKPEQSIIWQEGDPKDGIWCRARPDWLSFDRRIFLDYKSTAASANPDDWVKTMAGLGGEVQESFYVRGNTMTGGPPDAKFLFLVQEVKPPYACCIIGLAPAFRALGNSKVAMAQELWRRCMRDNVWPGYPNRICWITPPPWHQMKWEEKIGMSLADEERSMPEEAGDLAQLGRRGSANENDPAWK